MPHRVSQVELASFETAKEEIAVGVRASGIEVMMRLALDGKSGVKKWAQTYMRQMLNVEILDTTDEAASATDRIQGSMPDRPA